MRDYTNLREFSRSAAAVRRIAKIRGYKGTIHEPTRKGKVGSLGQQLDAVGIYIDARRQYGRVPRQWILEMSKSAVMQGGENVNRQETN